MTFEEFLGFHQQWSVSIEQNIGALVEAQQRTEQRVDALAQRVDALGQVTGTLIQVSERTLAMFQDMIRHQEQTDQRIDRLAENQQRLEDTLQRFLDSQIGGDGRN